MPAPPHDTMTRNPEQPDGPSRESAKERSRRRESEKRIGAVQLAAPSTRTWRRAGRFEEAGSQ